jgi:hypothetical protein
MKAQDRLILGISMVIGTLAMISGIVALVYWLLGRLDPGGLRWYAVVVTLALPMLGVITWRLATHAAREHLAGFDRGLTGAQKAVESMGRSLSATASLARMARPAARSLPASAHEDLLPRVGTMRLVEAQNDADELIDL